MYLLIAELTFFIMPFKACWVSSHPDSEWNCPDDCSLSSRQVNVGIQDKLVQLSGKMIKTCLENVRELYPEL